MNQQLKEKIFPILSSDKSTFRYFNVMYAIALIAVALVSITSYFLVQHLIGQQKNDSNIINIAGRQRMLSQNITKNVLLITNEPSFDQYKFKLEASHKLFIQNHIALSTRDSSLNLDSPYSDEINRLFTDIEPYFSEINRGVNGILNEYPYNLEVYKKVILDNETSFLIRMDEIVYQIAEESKLRTAKLRQLESVLLIIVLFTLLLEVLFIFNPVGKKIRKVIADLVESESKANSLAEEIRDANASLVKSNKDIRDINFALNEATILIKINEHGKIIHANHQYCRITKYDFEELKGKLLFENNMGGEESVIYKHIRDPERREQMWQGEIYDHAKDFTFFWLDVTLIPIKSIQGEVYQYLVICSNVTQRKEAEATLQKINDARLRKQKYEQKLRSLSIITGQERERKRMSQEVHDGIGQMLTALKFGLESLSSTSEKENERLTGLKQLVHQTIKEVRRISSDLLPTVLNDYGLSAALKELMSMSKPATDINLVFEDRMDLDERLNRNIEVSLYRICQESINNAIKYSKAETIKVKLTSDVEFLNLIIEDDGVGFDIEEIEKINRTKESGNGLNNMRERAELINSKLYINSNTSKGTTIFVEVPLDEDSFNLSYE